jgi:DNA-binding NarL/FixJ family response regulator
MKMRTNPIPDARIRVVVADDHPIVRGMVRSALQQHPHFEVCGEAENGADAIEEVKRARPDVVVLNVTMPLVNGFEAAREIKKQIPETAIVILSSHADVHFVAEAKKLGVRTYVSKSKIGQALVDAVELRWQGTILSSLSKRGQLPSCCQSWRGKD